MGHHSCNQRSLCHVSRGPLNTTEHHSWDQRSQCHAVVTLSRESWFIEHDGTSQLGSTVTVSRESWFIEHDGTSQLGSMVTVSRNGHSVMQWSQRHVNRDPVNTMGHHSWDQRPQCHAMVTLSRESWFTEHAGTSQLGSGVRVHSNHCP